MSDIILKIKKFEKSIKINKILRNLKISEQLFDILFQLVYSCVYERQLLRGDMNGHV
jgi:S-adenosylmethionine:diacylglycerol 3-amino-3-carboxypropyl transferase